MGLCNRSKEGICAKKGEGVFIVKRRKGRGERVYLKTTEKGVYPTIKVTTDGTGILCGEEGWKEKDGPGL